MAQAPDNYFDELEEWSARKLTLLEKYLDGAVRILQLKGRVHYVDCFAGKGSYGKEGEAKLPGSPVRAALLSQRCLDAGRSYSLECINVEERAIYFRELEQTTAPYRQFVTNLRGTFASHINRILQAIHHHPTICFLDPFGVEGMDWGPVSRLIGRPGATDLWIRFDTLTVRRRAGWYEKIGQDPSASAQFDVLMRVYGASDPYQLHTQLEAAPTEVARKEVALALYMERVREEYRRVKGSGYVYAYRIGTLNQETKYYLIIATAHPKAVVLASNIVHDVEREYRRAIDRLQREGYLVTMFDDIDPSEDEVSAAIVNELIKRIWPRFQGVQISRTDLHAALLDGHFEELAHCDTLDGQVCPTARKYLRAGKPPSALKQPRTHRTHPNPFAAHWPWVEQQLQRDPALQAKTLFTLFCEQHPDRYPAGQLRTFQRHVAQWRALHGPEQDVVFAQVHQPGWLGQSDFTDMRDLAITLAGVPFPHLLFHLVLTYANVEAVSLCFSESFEALAEGIEACLWQLIGVPAQHRTDNLSADVQTIEPDRTRRWTDRYQGLMAHYGMTPTTNTPGEAHENGDVEQAHHRFKQAVDQALRVRGSRDFPDRAAYVVWLQELVRKRNQTRQTRWAQELAALRPLPRTPLHPCREERVVVSRFSTIRVMHNTYSVPSRLIGTTLTVRVRAEVLECSLGATYALTLPRLFLIL
jgi:three-Cys-motif partner protein